MARRIARELDKILDGDNPRQVAIKRAAAELRLTTRQIYNLLARYRADARRQRWSLLREPAADWPQREARITRPAA